MNNTQTRTIAIFVLLAVLMAATRFNHFGSAVSLPDASLAVFFLGGLFLPLSARNAIAAFSMLVLEAGLIDFYATSVQGISDWCMTPAYGFLIPTYGSLWWAGRWCGSRFDFQRHAALGKALPVIVIVAWAANSFAFVLSNAAFYLFSEHFANMSAVEYAARVARYYGSYVFVALLYIACAAALHAALGLFGRQWVQSRSGNAQV